MLYFSKCAFEYIDLLVILVGVYLIQNQASRPFSIFCLCPARVVFQLRSGLEIRDQLFCDAEFSLELLFFAYVVSNLESFIRLIFCICHDFYVIIFNAVQWRLKEIR